MKHPSRRIVWSVFAVVVFGSLLFCNEVATFVPAAEKQREINSLVLGMLILLSAWCASPWFRWRFSTRTLLIGTTLFAVGLGLIVWLL
jgi:hypothetical protein